MTTVKKYGFKDQGDLDDGYHVIEWERELVDGEWENTYQSASLQVIMFGDNSDSSLRPFNSSSTGGFKFFIPPGTFKAIVTCFHEGQTSVSMAIRYNNLPNYSSSVDPSNTQYGGIGGIWTLSDMINEDPTIYLLNHGGHTTIFDGTIINEDPYYVTEAQAGFMYGNVYLNKTAVAAIQISITVRYDIYQPWYESYDWDVDSFGLQTQINECEGYPT